MAILPQVNIAMLKAHNLQRVLPQLFVFSLCISLTSALFAQDDATEWTTDPLPPAEELPQPEPESSPEPAESELADTEYQPANKPAWRKRGYHFGIGIAQPQNFGSQYNHYEKLFGKPKIHPTVWGEYYFFNLGVDFGFRSAISYYTARGYAAKDLNVADFPLEQDITDNQVDRTQESQLTLIPVQAAGTISFSPFRARWVVFQGWYGMQWVYVQNTMYSKASENQKGSTYLNSGWNEEQVYGAAISFDLSWIDARSTYSMRVFGISGLYLTPFMEVQKSTSSEFGVYDRENYGLMFTFETLR
ncbi:MAG: hypothetical protein ACOH5I_03565 [Oligoflexus sp.]